MQRFINLCTIVKRLGVKQNKKGKWLLWYKLDDDSIHYMRNSVYYEFPNKKEAVRTLQQLKTLGGFYRDHCNPNNYMDNITIKGILTPEGLFVDNKPFKIALKDFYKIHKGKEVEIDIKVLKKK